MKIKFKNLFISIHITGVIAVFVFLINDKQTELGPSFGAYVKEQIIWYLATTLGLINIFAAVVLRLSKKTGYTRTLYYQFSGVLNFVIGIYGLFVIQLLHSHLVNLLIGVLILADVFLTGDGEGVG